MSEEDKSDITKEITLTPSLTSLLKPTTKLLGEELKDFVKKNIDTIKELNREKNLQFHLEKINGIVEKDEKWNIDEEIENEELLKNAENLFASLETVQDIDPSEKELSEIWQHLIASLRLGKNVPKHLIEALRNISPLEATILFELQRQENFGLLRNFSQFIGYVFVPIRAQVNIEGADRNTASNEKLTS